VPFCAHLTDAEVEAQGGEGSHPSYELLQLGPLHSGPEPLLFIPTGGSSYFVTWSLKKKRKVDY
jgi:hypothetical protein